MAETAGATNIGAVDVATTCGVVRVSDGSGARRIVSWRSKNPKTWGHHLNLNNLGWNSASSIAINSGGANFNLKTLCYDNANGRAYTSSSTVR